MTTLCPRRGARTRAATAPLPPVGIGTEGTAKTAAYGSQEPATRTPIRPLSTPSSALRGAR